MSGQRHRIRRQVLEIVLPDQGAAWQLSAELGRIQRESLEAIIDRCCTEAGDPDRLHRIESLEVDLGHIHPDHLERELGERLGPQLREALAAAVRADDQAPSLAGADPETRSRLELVAFFTRTGTLPWWADAARPRRVDDAVGLLLQRAARPLVALVRTLARSRAELGRLVLHCEDERLSALLSALVAAGPRGRAQRLAEVHGLLAAHRAIAGIQPGSFRRAVWMAVLRAASAEDRAGADALGFWREALAQAALELGVTYTVLVAGLHEIPESRADRPGAAAIAAVVHRLYREVRGEAVAGEPAAREILAQAAGGPDERAAILERLDELGIEPGAFLAALLRALDELEAAAPDEDFREARGLLQGVIERRGGDREAPGPGAPAHRVEVARPASPPPGATQEAPPPRSEAIEEPGEAARIEGETDGDLAEPLGRPSTWEGLGQVLASGRVPARVIERALEELERAAAPAAKARDEARRRIRDAAPGSLPLDLVHADSEDAYVENAGLVILWPFLGPLFERQGLMADKQFKDPAARHRAVGLLQYLATEDPRPEEYQLLLAKVLCGMNVHEVFDFGPPVTEAEAEEGANLLTAVIANAPILRDMSTAGFRGSFLLRKGVLGARDGAWLLRVERATHDVVLDRFPWAVSWVKLPWMEAPLHVEW